MLDFCEDCHPVIRMVSLCELEHAHASGVLVGRLCKLLQKRLFTFVQIEHLSFLDKIVW